MTVSHRQGLLTKENNVDQYHSEEARPAKTAWDAQGTSATPGAQVPPVNIVTEQVNADTVALKYVLGPDDRRMVRESNQREAMHHADRIGNPAGLAGLFPTNRLKWKTRKVQPMPIQETQA